MRPFYGEDTCFRSFLRQAFLRGKFPAERWMIQCFRSSGLSRCAPHHKPRFSPMASPIGLVGCLGLEPRLGDYKSPRLTDCRNTPYRWGMSFQSHPPVRQDPLKLDGACCGRCIQISSNLYRALFSILLLGRLLFLFCVHVQTSGLQSFNAASRIVILQPIARKEERRMGALAGFSHLSLIHHRNG